MALIEKTESQRIRVTADGTVFERIFALTWSDWNTTGFPYYIGQTLAADAFGVFPVTEWTSSLVIQDIDVRVETGNNLLASVYYSTKGSVYGVKERPDQKASWRESFDISLQERALTTYLSQTQDSSGRTMQSWPAIWSLTDFADEPVPEVTVYEPTMTKTLTAYGSVLHIARMIINVGKVNKESFLARYFLTQQGTSISSDLYAAFDDVGKWIFLGCRINRIRTDCWQFDMSFLYNKYKWNEPFGNSLKYNSDNGGGVVDIQYYDEFSFEDLLAGMSETDTAQLPTGYIA